MRDPEVLIELAHKLEDAREKYLKWKQVCERYDRGKHTVFAQEYRRVTREDLTNRDREMIAYESKEYREYLEKWDRVEQNKIDAQIEYENLENNFEAYQSAIAYDREAFKKLGG